MPHHRLRAQEAQDSFVKNLWNTSSFSGFLLRRGRTDTSDLEPGNASAFPLRNYPSVGVDVTWVNC